MVNNGGPRGMRGQLILLLGVLSGVVLMGCGGSSYNSNSTTNKPITTGFLRLVNTVPDSPTLLAGVDATVLTRVSFAQATGLQQLKTNKYAIDVQYLDVKGSTVDLIKKEKITIGVEDQLTMFIVGSLDAPHTHIVDNQTPAIAAGSAEVQVMQTVATLSNVDVYLTDANADLATSTKLTTVAYDQSSELATIPSGGNYRLRVTPPGSTTVLYDSGAFAIADTTRLMFVVVDYFGPGGSGFRVVQLNNQSATTFPNEVLPGAARIANMIADVPSVDLYIGAVSGTPAFAGVPFGSVAALQDVTPGTLTCTLTPAGDPATILFSGPVIWASGETRTLVAVRSLGGVAVRATLDLTRPISGFSQIEVINAAPTALAVDTFLIEAGKTLANTTASIINQPLLAFAGAVAPPGTYDVAFTATATTTAIAGPDPLTVTDGSINSIFAIDAAGGGTPYQIVISTN